MQGTPPSYTEEPAAYVVNIVLTANQALQRVPVPIDRDSDFLLIGVNGTCTALYSFNVRMPSGRLYASSQINCAPQGNAANNFIGTPNQPTTFGPPPNYRAGGVGPELDLTDLSGATNTVQLVFQGVRRLLTS
jgi:hypothetical protein